VAPCQQRRHLSGSGDLVGTWREGGPRWLNHEGLPTTSRASVTPAPRSGTGIGWGTRHARAAWSPPLHRRAWRWGGSTMPTLNSPLTRSAGARPRLPGRDARAHRLLVARRDMLLRRRRAGRCARAGAGGTARRVLGGAEPVGTPERPTCTTPSTSWRAQRPHRVRRDVRRASARAEVLARSPTRPPSPVYSLSRATRAIIVATTTATGGRRGPVRNRHYSRPTSEPIATAPPSTVLAVVSERLLCLHECSATVPSMAGWTASASWLAGG
jgi:hypothetical protein